MNRLTLVAAALLLSGAAASADPVHWSYSWDSSPQAISANGSGSGTIFLLDPQPGTGTGSMHIGGTQFGLNTIATPANPDQFTSKPFTLNLALTDAASGAQGQLSFAGLLNATMSTGSANVSTSFPGGTTKSVTLGGNSYTVVLDGFTQPTLTTPAGFGAQVTAAAGTPLAPPPPTPPPAPPPPSKITPEPSAGVLAGLGLAVTGLAARRKTARLATASRGRGLVQLNRGRSDP
jgi:hypothetical protein